VELADVKAASENKIRTLQEELSKQPNQDDWAIAHEVEKTFRINLEAIKLTREELDTKRKS
jgi:hypothetical protein